ncbi:MAG: thioeseterase [Rhodobacteraceae bacterium]|jgi:acyl-CoA thioesterase FadM|uniref:Putative thioesterase n=1 Tax=Salipiger profundus TaxID=1229727 RepID=A0A1U7D1Y2_9RHOB|nr:MULTISPECIES: acyl-CoA thioesterase [Salipiger]APX22080.1 putative thioesterase [Salipiger profundus]MAB08249.1 thioeseterase [Paracoccaceae bacterium]GGA07404.1 thioeseterase [Salipiger profundus]SFC44047.1 Acyl-CoA thioesterase FadM [Salipiger profundus]
MYPFIRMTKELWRARSQPRLALGETHVSHHVCWPWDLDLWKELNNGRTLTLYDLGRLPLAQRSGLIDVLKRERWGLTMAGVCVRYRRRVRLMERVEMRSRLIGWDRRFLYIEQSMWKAGGECANQAVYRGAVTDRNGIVTTDRIMAAMGHEATSPELPEWVRLWLEAEDARPWPPQM